MDKAIQWSLGLSLIGLSFSAPNAAYAQAQNWAQAQGQMPSRGNRGPDLAGHRNRGHYGDRNGPRVDVNRSVRGPGNGPDRSIGAPPPVQSAGRIDNDLRDRGPVDNNRGSAHIGNHTPPAGEHRGNGYNRPEVRGWAHRGQHSPVGRDHHGYAGRGNGYNRPEVRGWAHRGQHSPIGRDYLGYAGRGNGYGGRYAPGLIGRANFYGGWAYAAYSPRVVVAVVPVAYRGWAVNYPVASYRQVQPYRGWAYSPAGRSPYRGGR